MDKSQGDRMKALQIIDHIIYGILETSCLVYPKVNIMLPILPMLLIELEWDFYIGSSIFLEFLLMANSKVFYLHHRKSNHNSWGCPDNCKSWQQRQWWWCPWSLERLSTEQLHKYVGSSRRSSEGSSHVHDVLFGCRHTLHQMWRRR